MIDRLALVLAFFSDLSYREVAAELGISERTARRQIRSGLCRLHAELPRGPSEQRPPSTEAAR